MSDNPTTISGKQPPAAPQSFHIEIDYAPATGQFQITGNVHEPLVMHGLLGMAAASFERDLARRAAVSMHLPPGVGPIAIPRRGGR